MAERKRIVLFCEDDEHEAFVRAIVGRLCADKGVRPSITAQSTRGGHPRAVAELKAWQKTYRHLSGIPDLLILLIDANCQGWNPVRDNLVAAIDPAVVPRAVVGCPDPHVERWLIADPSAFQQVVGSPPGADPGKCDRTFYKNLVTDRIAAGSEVVVTGPADLIPDLVDEMDLYRAGKNQPSLKHFLDDLRTALEPVRR